MTLIALVHLGQSLSFVRTSGRWNERITKEWPLLTQSIRGLYKERHGRNNIPSIILLPLGPERFSELM